MKPGNRPSPGGEPRSGKVPSPAGRDASGEMRGGMRDHRPLLVEEAFLLLKQRQNRSEATGCRGRGREPSGWFGVGSWSQLSR